MVVAKKSPSEKYIYPDRIIPKSPINVASKKTADFDPSTKRNIVCYMVIVLAIYSLLARDRVIQKLIWYLKSLICF